MARKEKSKRRKKRKKNPHTNDQGIFSPSSETSNFGVPKNSRTASVKLSLLARSLIVVLLGLTLYPLPISKANPFRPLKTPPVFHQISLLHFCHNLRISLVRPLHSLRRWPLLCLLSVLRHRLLSKSVFPYLSFKKGTTIACPLRSW